MSFTYDLFDAIKYNCLNPGKLCLMVYLLTIFFYEIFGENSNFLKGIDCMNKKIVH